MIKRGSAYAKARWIFLVGFILSLCVTVTMAGMLVTGTELPFLAATPTPKPTATFTATPTLSITSTAISIVTVNPNGTFTPVPPTSTATVTPTTTPLIIISPAISSEPGETLVLMLGTGLISFLLLLGFVSTTVLGWRKDEREAKATDLARQQAELQIEKERQGLGPTLEVKAKPGGAPAPRGKEAEDDAMRTARLPTARLEGLNGPTAGQVFPLTDGTVMGRSSQSSYQIPDPAISRQHVRLRFGEGRWFIQDMHSAGGTYVNGKRVGATALKNGDHIRIGSTEFEFRE